MAPSVDDDHRAHSTTFTKPLAEPDAGSPIAALPAKMLHAVLSRVDDLDLPACLFVCLGWAQTIASRAAHVVQALLPRRLLSQRLAAEGRLGALQWARLTLRIPWDAATSTWRGQVLGRARALAFALAQLKFGLHLSREH
jgi:hypothetical protein